MPLLRRDVAKRAGWIVRPLDFAAPILAVFVATGCGTDHSLDSEEIDRLAAGNSPTRTNVESMRIFLDTSGSMRGFGLRATANERGAAEEFQGILAALETIASTVEKKRSVDAAAAPATGQNGDASKASVARLRFGSVVEEFAPGASLLDIGVGRAATSAIGGVPLGSNWRSSDCAQRWTGAQTIRTRIDALYSEQITCLNPVFDSILADQGSDRAYVVVTDAEQDAPESDTRCASARNLGTIQARLHQWVERGNYAAAVVFKLRTFPWQAAAVGRRYCECDSRLLFAYVMTPTADVAEKIFAELSSNWKGPDDAIAYVPFVPRPASEFTVALDVAANADGIAANFRGDKEKHLTEPEAGVLPQFWIRLQEGEAQLTFTLKQAGFEDARTRKGIGFVPLDWKTAEYEWQSPKRAERGQAHDGSNHIRLSVDAVGLSFTRIIGAQGSTSPRDPESRTASYHATSTMLDPKVLSDRLTDAAFVVRKRPGQKKSCEFFLFEVHTKLADVLDQLTARLPLVRDARRPCLSLDTLRSQVQFVNGSAPLARFLLHVDYD